MAVAAAAAAAAVVDVHHHIQRIRRSYTACVQVNLLLLVASHSAAFWGRKKHFFLPICWSTWENKWRRSLKSPPIQAHGGREYLFEFCALWEVVRRRRRRWRWRWENNVGFYIIEQHNTCGMSCRSTAPFLCAAASAAALCEIKVVWPVFFSLQRRQRQWRRRHQQKLAHMHTRRHTPYMYRRGTARRRLHTLSHRVCVRACVCWFTAQSGALLLTRARSILFGFYM